MGMDVYADGELTIPATKVAEARDLFLKVLAEGEKNLFLDPKWLKQRWIREPWAPDEDDPVETPEEFVLLLEEKFDRFGVGLEDDGRLTFCLGGSCRHEENDQWIFVALEDLIDDGEFCFSGDGYQWKWVVEGGVLSESSGETVYDHDEKAVPTIEKIVTLVYPDGLEGKPITSMPDADLEWVVGMIENLLRESGYGPQAGKNELDRLAEV